MKKTLIVLVACLSIMLVASVAMAIGTSGSLTNPYGYYGNPYGYCGTSGCGTPMPHPLPYSSVPCMQWHPTGYCVQWYPERWIPVQVMIPGRWIYRPVWIQAREVTLYQYVPGYWHRTNLYGTPDVRVMRTPNGWYATPYQSQIGDGSFDAASPQLSPVKPPVYPSQTGGGSFDTQGVWQPAREK